MTFDQTIVFVVLITTIFLFIFGKWRYDIVALLSLLAIGICNILPADRLFNGFGHPAVITVAAVLVISKGLHNSGFIDRLARRLERLGSSIFLQIFVLTTIVVILSGFINNVGALAIIMPVAIHLARRSHRSPSYILMPLAFGSLLGGLTTLIGTPPNIIIGTFRENTANDVPAFGMFAFTPVGISLAILGLCYIVIFGWRFIPKRRGQESQDTLFHTKEYTTEVRVPENSDLVGKPLSYLENITGNSVTIIGLVRGKNTIAAPSGFESIWANDYLIIEAHPDTMKEFVDIANLELLHSGEDIEGVFKSKDVAIVEAIVAPGSHIIGKNAKSLHMRLRFGLNLVAVARQGQRLEERIGHIRFESGDLLLFQCANDSIQESLSAISCLPLAHRSLRLGGKKRVLLALSIFGIGIAATVSGYVPIQVAFTASAVAMIIVRLVSFQEVYRAIDWPVIILLGAMIPLGEALETTGGAQLIAERLVAVTTFISPSATMAALLVMTIALSNVMNNAAVAVLMAPIALSISQDLFLSADPFLMTVAVGASTPFLTPIGHQSNAIVMGPAGYEFQDYWRMGLALTVIIIVAAIPLINFFWPLTAI